MSSTKSVSIVGYEMLVWASLDESCSNDSLRDLCAAIEVSFPGYQLLVLNIRGGNPRLVLVSTDPEFSAWVASGFSFDQRWCNLRARVEEIRMFSNGFLVCKGSDNDPELSWISGCGDCEAMWCLDDSTYETRKNLRDHLIQLGAQELPNSYLIQDDVEEEEEEEVF